MDRVMWFLWPILLSAIQAYDKETDEISEKVIFNEYYYLFRISAGFPNLNKKTNIILHSIQIICYFTILISHIYFFIMTAFYNTDDFLLMINSFNFAIITAFFSFFLYTMLKHRADITIIHRMIGNGVYIYELEELDNEQVYNIKNKHLNFKKLLKTIMPIVNFLCGFFVIILCPYIDKLFGYIDNRIYIEKGINLLLPIPILYPFDTFEGGGFIFCLLMQLSLGLILVSILISMSSIYITICTHITLQLDLLKHSIQNIEQRTRKLYDRLFYKKSDTLEIANLYKNEEFSKCLEFCLVQNIKHHQQILRMHNHLLNLAKFVLVASVGSGGIMVAVSAFLAILVTDRPGGLVGFFVLCISQIFNILSLCYMGQLISDMNNQLNLEIYTVKWFYYTKNINKYLSILQLYTGKDMAVAGAFSLIANMETFGSIMNSAYSYMSLLHAWNSS